MKGVSRETLKRDTNRSLLFDSKRFFGIEPMVAGIRWSSVSFASRIYGGKERALSRAKIISIERGLKLHGQSRRFTKSGDVGSTCCSFCILSEPDWRDARRRSLLLLLSSLSSRLSFFPSFPAVHRDGNISLETDYSSRNPPQLRIQPSLRSSRLN